VVPLSLEEVFLPVDGMEWVSRLSGFSCLNFFLGVQVHVVICLNMFVLTAGMVL
jgi:hypothetical protein